MYDAAGNMTFDATPPTQTYTFDQENRITGANGYTYTYDSNGNRARKSNGTLAANGTLYWYMSPGIVAESDLAGTTTSEYVFFEGERVARRDGVNGAGGVRYYFSDRLKTASVITDASGTIKAESDYYPWGGELQFTNNDSNHYKFIGKERDGETGLDYFGARYYANGLGRFGSADPNNEGAEATEPQSWNAYSYAANNPLIYIDPDGRDYHFCFFGKCGDLSDRQYDNWLRIWGPNVIVTPSGRILDRATEKEVGFAHWFDGAAARQAENAVAVTQAFMVNQALDMIGGALEIGITNAAARLIPPLITRNKLVGTLGERTVSAMLRLKGYKIVGSQVTVKTSKGIRYVDYVV